MCSRANKKRVHVYVDGRVQGVGFRYFTVNEAQRVGVVGWVRNLPDGRVEAVAEGTEEQLTQFVTSLQRGPSFGHVTTCDVSWMEATGDFKRFSVSM